MPPLTRLQYLEAEWPVGCEELRMQGAVACLGRLKALGALDHLLTAAAVEAAAPAVAEALREDGRGEVVARAREHLASIAGVSDVTPVIEDIAEGLDDLARAAGKKVPPALASGFSLLCSGLRDLDAAVRNLLELTKESA